MTYLEKYKQDHPDARYSCYGLPVDCDCPRDCGYETVSFLRGCPFPGLKCEDCWNREMPEEKEGENMRTKVLEKEPEKTRYIRIAVDEDTYSDLVNGAETTHIVVGPEDVVEAEPISQNPDILNITIHTNELKNSAETLADIFKHIPDIKERMINITIM